MQKKDDANKNYAMDDKRNIKTPGTGKYSAFVYITHGLKIETHLLIQNN